MKVQSVVGVCKEVTQRERAEGIKALVCYELLWLHLKFSQKSCLYG